MSLSLEVSMAEAQDGESLGAIMLRAMEPHMIDRFMVLEDDFQAAYQSKMKWFLAEFSNSLKDPTKKVFKAAVKETGELVGLAAIEYRDDGDHKDSESKNEEATDTINDANLFTPVVAALPAEKKAGFAQYYFGRSKEIHAKHMAGVKHVIWTTLHIKPSFQGKGIGGALLRWGFKEFNLEKELVWISTQMRGRNIYKRFGWEDKDHLDIDLSDWGGKLRGFGIHRTPYMLRQPGEFKKLDGFIDE